MEVRVTPRALLGMKGKKVERNCTDRACTYLLWVVDVVPFALWVVALPPYITYNNGNIRTMEMSPQFLLLRQTREMEMESGIRRRGRIDEEE